MIILQLAKLSNCKERPTTPEIHIIDTPRQMHSLTARSLSREFREGLRLIGSKAQAPSTAAAAAAAAAATDTIPERKQLARVPLQENSMANAKNSSTMTPGKLKNNIQFWEQLQRKN